MSDALRKNAHAALLVASMPSLVRNLGLLPERLASLRGKQLRRMLVHARAHSPWHRERLPSDVAEIGEEDLAALPIMTKDDVMDYFDHIVTDRDVRQTDALAHLERHCASKLFRHRYRVVTSSGSSGRPGVFMFDPAGWRRVQAANMRMTLRHKLRTGQLLEPLRIAVVAASSPTHLSTVVVEQYTSTRVPFYRLPVTMAFPDIVAGLNAAAPSYLVGYASMLAELADAARRGRLHISPTRIASCSEPLLPEHKRALRLAWPNAAIANVWASSEFGPLAAGCYEAEGMHLTDDGLIVELVDERGRPVPPGRTADKVLVTSLFNDVFPLIRYELNDRVRLLEEECPCGSTHRRIADIESRFDEIFMYGPDVRVHTHVFRSALSTETGMRDYQIVQTPRGVQVRLRLVKPVDIEALRLKVVGKLRDVGLADPEVSIDTHTPFDRLPSGKLKRYVPLGFDTRVAEDIPATAAQ